MEIVPDPPTPLRKVPDPAPQSSTYVKWENPPAPSTIPTRLQRVTAELQRRPGEWALIAAKSSPLMAWWRPLTAHPDFEITYRNYDDVLLLAPRDVYARYIGKES